MGELDPSSEAETSPVHDIAGDTGVTLRRTVSRWQVVGLAVNDVIGSGVYLLPAATAALLGAASLAGVGLAAVAVLLIVLCFAEASSRFDEPGGGYVYAREAFGDLIGFEVGWMTWLARVASLASLSVGFALALSYLVPAAGEGTGRAITIVTLIVGLTVINIVGVEAGARTAVALALGKLVPLLVFIGAGIFAARWSTVAAQPVPETRGMGEAALLLMFAYAGFENTPAPAGEYRRPQRDIPFALIVNLALVATVYLGVQWVALGTLPNLGASETPLADAAAIFLGGWGGWLLTVGAVISILGTNSNTVLAAPRYLFALARDGYGPRWIAHVHPRFRTPANAILLHSAIALPLALSGSFAGLAALSVLARLATYLGTTAAVPVLRRREDLPEAAFRLPGGATIPILASLITVALAASAGRDNLMAGGVALGVGLVIFGLRRRQR